jgi:hypothetical protein
MNVNLNLDIPQEDMRTLESCAASLGEDLATHAGHVLVKYATTMRQSPTAPANSNLMSRLDEAPLPANIEDRTKLARALLQQYAREQGVGKFVLDPLGMGDRHPEDGPAELIDQGIRAMRDLDSCRVSP